MKDNFTIVQMKGFFFISQQLILLGSRHVGKLLKNRVHHVN